MEHAMDSFELGKQQVDPETFRRVWARVMPDQKNSPIVVEPASPPEKQTRAAMPLKQPRTAPPAPQMPAPPTPKTPAPPTPNMSAPPVPKMSVPPAPKTSAGAGPQAAPMPPQPKAGPEKEQCDEERLRRLMDLSQEGFAACQMLARRAGNQARALSGLAADHRRAHRQLAAAYFLATGRRYQPKNAAPVLNGVLIIALREQFLWEQRWARTCLQTAEETADRDLQDLCRELAQDAALHNRTIRGVLERL